MALAAPDYFAGANDPKKGAYALFATAGWIRRRCNEITAEAALDVFKIYDLASNCFLFQQEADKWRVAGEITQVLQELAALTLAAGAGNSSKTPGEINADYKALYATAGNFIAWAAANLPAVGANVVGPTVTVNRTWPSPDLTVRVAKAAAVTTQVNTLLAAFA